MESFGNRIRQKRTEARLSLRALAGKVGVTASFLSQVERNLTKPSVDTLRKISIVLDIPVFELLHEPKNDNPVVRGKDREKYNFSNLLAEYEVLTPTLQKQMQVFLARMKPSELNFATNLGRDTEECIIVLHGKLKVQLNDQLYTLEPDDSIYFEGKSLRLLQSVGEEELVFISAITPPAF